MTNEYRYFLKLSFVGVNRFFVLISLNKCNDLKWFKGSTLFTKSISKTYSIIINGKNLYDQAVDSSIERYEEIRKLTTGQVNITLPGSCYINNLSQIFIN